MWILYGYIITLVVRVISPGSSSYVIVSCASCTDGSKLKGLAGKDLIIQYKITNITNFYLLEITYKESIIDINPTTVNSKKVKDKRLFVPKKFINNGDSISIDITLKTLSLEDNDAVFSYVYTNNDLNRFPGKDLVVVKAPPTFCKKLPEKTYEIEAGKEHRIEFSLCGNPKPTAVTAKVGSVIVTVTPGRNSTYKYTYNYEVKITMNKEQCGDNLKITAESFQTKSSDSTIKLLFQPGKVKNVFANRDGNNLAIVSWQKIVQYGSCKVWYHVRHKSNNSKTEVYRTDELTYKFHNAEGNNSFDVNAEVNGKAGAWSDPVFITAHIEPTPSRVAGGKDDGLGTGPIIGIVIGILLIIGCIIAVVIQKRRGGGKGDKKSKDNVAPIYTWNESEEFDHVNDFMQEKQQPDKQQMIYAELGPGGGRTGEKPVPEKSKYATAKTEGVHYPELEKPKKPLVSSSSSKSKPSLSSLSKEHDDSSFDYESSIMI